MKGRVLVVDDEKLSRLTLTRQLEQDGWEAEACETAYAALEKARSREIDAVVTDLKMPGMDGIQLLKEIKKTRPETQVIMITGHGTVEMCRRAFKSGAAEFLEKPVDDELLLEVLQNAVRQHVRSRERHQANRQARMLFAQLSEREREVLGFIVDGLTNKEIGRVLGLSPRTVETHRANLFAKLQVESLAHLIRHYATLVTQAPAP